MFGETKLKKNNKLLVLLSSKIGKSYGKGQKSISPLFELKEFIASVF